MTIEERLTAIETDIADIKEAIATLGGGGKFGSNYGLRYKRIC